MAFSLDDAVIAAAVVAAGVGATCLIGCAISTAGGWQGAALTVCGLAVSLPLAIASLADADGGPTACDPSSRRLDGLPYPELPSAALTRIVRPGDSLWSITRERLSATSDARIAEAVADLYAANRAVIGANPDLIFPGTELTAPGGVR